LQGKLATDISYDEVSIASRLIGNENRWGYHCDIVAIGLAVAAVVSQGTSQESAERVPATAPLP